MNFAVIDIYHHFQFSVLNRLKEQIDCHYSYVISGTVHNYHGDIEEIGRIKKLIFSDGGQIDQISKFLSKDQINSLVTSSWLVNDEILARLKETEIQFLRISDRNTARPISVHQRRQYYLILLNYFLNIVESKTFDQVLTFDTPHSCHSSIFYALMRSRGVPVVRMESHRLTDHSLLLPTYHLPELPKDYLIGASLEEISEQIDKTVLNALNSTNSDLDATKKRQASRIIGKGRNSVFRLFSRAVFKFSANVIMGVFPFLFKREILHFTAFNSVGSRLSYRLLLNTKLVALLRTNHYYNKISSAPNLQSNYVFYPLHMQPEKTSTPLAGEYDHQLLPIIQISQSIPEGWFLYVKEHPNQFNERKIVNNNYRTRSFYEAILLLSNVQFVPLQYPSDELISHARLVATLTGTVGWEALCSGKPALAFGEAYYRSCGAVRSPQSKEQCEEYIHELLEMEPETVRVHLLRYLAFYSTRGYLVHSANIENRIRSSGISREEQVSNTCQRIISFLEH